MPKQSHIHLAETLGVGPELAPIYKWSASDRNIIVDFEMQITKGLKGKRYAHVQKNAGVPVVYLDPVYQLTLSDDEDGDLTANDYLDRLVAMSGKHVYFVDNRHVNDGEDHTPYVKTAILSKVEGIKTDHIDLEFYFVQITLSTLTPI